MAQSEQKTPRSFSTVLEEAPIKIDGVLYQIKHPDSLPLGDVRRFEILVPRAEALIEKTDELTDDESLELSGILAKCCRMVLDSPPDVAAKLKDVQRLEIIRLFTQLRPVNQKNSRNTGKAGEAQSTGKKLFQRFKDSTAERPKVGSGRRR